MILLSSKELNPVNGPETMINRPNIIKVTLGKRAVGRIALNNTGVTVFEYDKEWIEKGFSISPLYLPLSSETFLARRDPFDGLFGVFNDSLPDGWGRLLIDRFVRSKGINPNTLSVLDRLSIVGKTGMGGLCYEPENKLAVDTDTYEIDFFAKEVEKILKDGDSEHLPLLVAKNGSSAGVRPKVIVNHEGEKWLVKFPALYDKPNIGKIEFLCSTLARLCGIEMAETQLFNNRYFGTKLFDRKGNERVHVHTVSGLLYANHRLPSLDYVDILKLTRAITHSFEEVEKMFRIMMFNVLIQNKDDHAKNFSFIHLRDRWVLSPAYDITPSSGFNENHTTTIMGQGNPSKSDMILLAREVGYPEKRVNEMYDFIYKTLQSHNWAERLEIDDLV